MDYWKLMQEIEAEIHPKPEDYETDQLREQDRRERAAFSEFMQRINEVSRPL